MREISLYGVRKVDNTKLGNILRCVTMNFPQQMGILLVLEVK